MRRLLLPVLCLLLVTCSSPEGGTGPTASVASVSVSPEFDTVYIGAVSQFTATPRDGSGDPLTGRSVTWTKTGAAATISNAGLVTGVASGDVTVTATSEGISGNATVFVRPVPVVSVLLTPPTDTIYLGATAIFSATPRDSIGGALTGRVVVWSSLDAAASVSNVGVVTPVGVGTARIVATVEGKADTTVATILPVPVASVVVTPAADTLYPSNTVQLTAATRDSIGGALAGRIVTWSSLDSAATVSNAGLVTAQGVGTARVVATSEGKADTALISVIAVPVASVTVTPGADTLYPTNTVQLTATTRDSANGVLAGRVVTWTSLDAAASVSGTGLVTAVSVGTARVVGTSEGKADTATITVLAVPVASVTVDPDSGQLNVGGTFQFTATPRDSAGGALAGRAVAWSTGDSAIATVSATGLVSGVSVGATVVVAASEGNDDTAVVVVDSVPVPLPPLTGTWALSINFAAPDPILDLTQSGDTVTGRWQGTATSAYGAVAGYVSGDSVSLTIFDYHDPLDDCDVVWTATRDGADAIIGTFLFVREGCALGGATGSLTGDRAASTASVVITSDIDSATVGDTAQLAAEARDSVGDPLASRPILWRSSDTTIVTVTPSGFAEAVGPGVALLIATGQGKADTASLTVVGGGGGGPTLTGSWLLSIDSAPHDLTLTLVQTGDSVSGSWYGVGIGDTGPVAGAVNGDSISLTIVDANDPADDCDVVWTAARFGADSLAGTYLFVRVGCSVLGTSGTLGGHRAAATASVVITSDIDSATVGDVRQLAAEARDSSGTPLLDRPVRWHSSDTTVVTVTPTGLAEAVAPGVALLIAYGQGKADTASLIVGSGGGGGGPPLTGTWSLSIDSAPHDLTLTLTQTGDSLSGSWQGSGVDDTGPVAGSVSGDSVSLTLFNVNNPADDCDAVWTATRFGPDSLAGTYLFVRAGCSLLGASGTLGGHRTTGGGGTTVIGPFDISVTSDREGAQGAASDGTNALVVYQRVTPGGGESPTGIYARLVDTAGNLLASEFNLGIHGDPPAVAYGGGVYLTAFWVGGTDSVVAQLINTSGTGIGGPIGVNIGPGTYQVCGLAYAGSTFYVTYLRTTSADTAGNPLYRVYGRTISTGGIVGSETQVSDGPGECTSVVAHLASDGTQFLAAWRVMDSLAGGGSTLKSRTISSGGVLGAVQQIVTTPYSVFGQSLAYRAGGGWVTGWSEITDTLGGGDTYQRMLDANGSPSGSLITIEAGGVPTFGYAADWPGGWVAIWTDHPATTADRRVRVRFYDATGTAVGPDIEAASPDLSAKVPMAILGAAVAGNALFLPIQFTVPGPTLQPDEETGDLRGVWVRP